MLKCKLQNFCSKGCFAGLIFGEVCFGGANIIGRNFG